MLGLHDIARLILILYCLNIHDNNRYDISIQFSIQYQDCGVKNLVLFFPLRVIPVNGHVL